VGAPVDAMDAYDGSRPAVGSATPPSPTDAAVVPPDQTHSRLLPMLHWGVCEG
jgi:hypothetical protein